MHLRHEIKSHKTWNTFRSALHALGLALILSLLTPLNTAIAQNACPTKSDLQQGIELRKSTKDAIRKFEVRKLNTKQKQALKLEADPLVSDYLLEDFTDGLKGDIGPRYWRRTVSYKGLFIRVFLVDTAANMTEYSQSLESIFPLTVGAQYEIPLTISSIRAGKSVSKSTGTKITTGTLKLNVLGKTKFMIGGCNYDAMILKTGYELSIPEGQKIKAMIKYYVPELGVTVLEGSISEKGIQVPNLPYKMDVEFLWDKIQKIPK